MDDAQRYRDEAAAKARARKERLARDKIAEDAEDEEERRKTAADKKKYDDLRAKGASAAANHASDLAAIQKKCEVDSAKGAEYK